MPMHDTKERSQMSEDHREPKTPLAAQPEPVRQSLRPLFDIFHYKIGSKKAQYSHNIPQLQNW